MPRSPRRVRVTRGAPPPPPPPARGGGGGGRPPRLRRWRLPLLLVSLLCAGVLCVARVSVVAADADADADAAADGGAAPPSVSARSELYVQLTRADGSAIGSEDLLRLLGAGFPSVDRGDTAARVRRPGSYASVAVYVARPDQLPALESLGFRCAVLPHPAGGGEDDDARAAGARKVAGTTPPLGEYHHYDELTDFLTQTLSVCPSGVAHMFSLGPSVAGRQVWALRLGTAPPGAVRPAVALLGNIHGDETVGREMLLYFADRLCRGAAGVLGAAGAQIRTLLAAADVLIVPSINPDGFELGPRRANANSYDLNRNFPDLRFPSRGTSPRQPETTAVMGLWDEHHVVLAVNLHGGALVANFPYDGNAGMRDGVLEASADHALYQHLALAYSQAHQRMHRSTWFHHGITNGAEWYTLFGGLQDWSYEAWGTMHVTMEIGGQKNPPASALPGLWEDNRDALLTFARQVHTGIRGVVVNASGAPLPASVALEGNMRVGATRPDTGAYFRLLKPGNYSVTASSPGFEPATRNVEVPVGQRPRPEEVVVLDFVLAPAAAPVASRARPARAAVRGGASLLE